MGGELVKEYVGIAMRGCHESASKHPLLAFMILVLIWIYRSFPTLFAFLVDASPVIASTTIILGTLLFFGQLHSPEIQKEGKPYHHKIHNLKFGVVGDTESDWKGARTGRRQKASRKRSCVVHRVNVNDNHHTVETDKLGSSIGEKFTNQKEKTILVDRSTQFPPLEAKDDDKGWETGSELAESTSPTASMAAGIIPMLHQLHHLHDHEEVPQHAHMSYLSTDAESFNSEENDHRDAIQVKHDEEKEEEEEDRKNLNENIIESAPVSMSRRSPSDLSYDSSRQESVPVDSSEPSKSNDQHHESFEVSPSTSMASKQGESGHNLGPQIVREPETPDATNYSSMNKEMDEASDSNTSSTPDTESISFPLNREADSTSIKEGFNAEPVALPHHEYEADLIAIKEGNNYGDDSTSIKSGIYTESDDPSREPDLISLKEGYYEDDTTSIKSGFYPESIASTRYEDYPYPSQEADSTSVKEGFDNYEDDPSRDADLISVKDSPYEDDYTSVKDSSYAESVASVYAEDDPSREADTNSVKEGYYASEMSDYVSQRSVSSEDDENVNDGRPDEVKTNGGSEKGYQVKSISESGSPPISDINDHIDDEDEDYRSVIMPMTSHSNDQKIQEQGNESSTVSNSASTAEVVESKTVDDSESNKTDFDNKKDDQNPKLENDDLSTVNKPNEGRFPQTFSQVQQGLTSLFKWKA
ncbi:hypothetical protein LXL04_004361 [Taraxacum kok-saghyz]